VAIFLLVQTCYTFVSREMRKNHVHGGPAFRPDLEGLRGIAILLVVAYHAGVRGFSGGYVGVDVFFVLSGYLISGLLLREFNATGRLDLIAFYARRARRLLPAASLVLVATIAACHFIYAPFEQQGFTGSAVATAAYLSNVWFAKNAIQYLAPDGASNPFLHTWSLAVEEQFYLVWPLMLMAMLYASSIVSRRRRVIAGMAVVAAASLAASIWLTGVAQPLAFFSSFTRAWEFAIGAIGAAITLDGTRWRAVSSWSGWAGACALAVAVVFFDATTKFPGYIAIVPALGTALLLTSQGPSAPTALTKVLSMNWLQAIGRVSYSWYLWHWPVLIIGQTLLGRDSLVVRLLLIGLAFVLANVTFHVLEHPIRSSKALSVRPRLSLALAASLTVVATCAGLGARLSAQIAAERPSQRTFTEAWHEVPKVYSTGCHLGFLDTEAPPCVFGRSDSSETIVLFGDSHAAQWFPAAERIADGRGWRLVSLTKSACPASNVTFVDPTLGREYTECLTWRRHAIERIVSLRPRAVLMGSANVYVSDGTRPSPWRVSLDEWLTGTRDTLAAFQRAGIETVLLRDMPRPGFDVPACLARSAWNPALFSNVCKFDRASSLNDSAFDAERRAAAGLENVIVADLTTTLCNTAICDPKNGEYVVYRDTNHLTTRFAASLATTIAARIDERRLQSVRSTSS
jgi:peptidoglycan/LPS O-acetylase OafA/YrhL